MPDSLNRRQVLRTRNLTPLMKDHENEAYFHEVSSWIKLAAFQASGWADT
jgi:hypothetical protein